MLFFIDVDWQIAILNAIKSTWPRSDIAACYFHFTKATSTKAEELLGKKNEDVIKDTMEAIKQATLTPLENLVEYIRWVEREVKSKHPNMQARLSAFFKYFNTTYAACTTFFSCSCEYQVDVWWSVFP